MTRPKILIVFLLPPEPANAERLARDAASAVQKNDALELWLIDDANIFPLDAAARRGLPSTPTSRLHVFRNLHRQGAGGNEKIAFRYAIDRNMDGVLFLREPIQDLEFLEKFLETLERHPDTDALLPRGDDGAFFTPRGALTRLFNFFTGKQIRGWHARAKFFRCRALSRVPFELDANGPQFDCEVLLQLVSSGARIEEPNVPGAFDLSWASVMAPAYVWNSLKATVKYRAQRYHLLYDLRFAASAPDAETPYNEKFDSDSPHAVLFRDAALVPEGSRVLDIGCAAGYVADRLAREKKCRVLGMDVLEPGTVNFSSFEYRQINLETELNRLEETLRRERPDVILILDVVEHLSQPERFLLLFYRQAGTPPPKLVISTANVAFISVRLLLMLGFFNYGRKGILDITHKRLFSARSFWNLLEQTGLVVLRQRYFPFPFRALGFPAGLARTLERINQGLIALWPSLFAYQIMAEAVPLSRPEQMIKDRVESETVSV